MKCNEYASHTASARIPRVYGRSVDRENYFAPDRGLLHTQGVYPDDDDDDDLDVIYHQPPISCKRGPISRQDRVKERWNIFSTCSKLVIFILVGLRVGLILDPFLGTLLVIIGFVVSVYDYFIHRRFFPSKTD